MSRTCLALMKSRLSRIGWHVVSCLERIVLRLSSFRLVSRHVSPPLGLRSRVYLTNVGFHGRRVYPSMVVKRQSLMDVVDHLLDKFMARNFHRPFGVDQLRKEVNKLPQIFERRRINETVRQFSIRHVKRVAEE